MNRRDIFKLFGGVTALPAVKAVETLRLEPNDTLVLKFDLYLTTRDRISESMKKKFPNRKVLILEMALTFKS